MDVLEHLIQEHRQVEDLLSRLASSSEGSERNSLFEELVTSLDTHMKVEERFVYPMIADLIGAKEAEDAEDEHTLAREGIEAARERLEEGAFEAAIETLTAGISHHVEEEENELFPQLRTKAADQLAGMDGARLESKVDGSDVDVDLTKEELYEKAKQQGIEGRSKMTKDELAEAVGRA
jgi:iron-sulfur cluster repair protein YtfE (RIC family)